MDGAGSKIKRWMRWTGPIGLVFLTPFSALMRAWRNGAEVAANSKTSALGEYGALAIRKELLDRGVVSVPCVRTIGRIWNCAALWMAVAVFVIGHRRQAGICPK